MIQILRSEKNSLQEIVYDFKSGIDVNNKWIHLTNPTDKEIELVERITAIPEDMLKAALDEEERARLEIDDGITLVLFDMPTIENENGYYNYSTMPFGAMLTPNCLVTVCLKESSIIHSIIGGNSKNINTANRVRLLYQMLYSTHIKFLQCLRQIDKSSGRIQAELRRNTKNKELIQLLDLENSLVYFSTSLRANNIVLDKLTRIKASACEDDIELLEDVSIENRQAIDMCNIYRDILSGTRDAYASVISNNLNMIMKVLTSLTVMISIPTLIASFWGMNTGVPFENQDWGFYIVLVIAAISTIICGIWLSKDQLKEIIRKYRKRK